jgi:hypothetical protein
MEYYATLKQMGKKTPKRFSKVKVVLHDCVFKYRQKTKLTEAFVKVTGLDDPGIRDAVKRSLFQNWGLVIDVYGSDDSPVSPSPAIPKVEEPKPSQAEKQPESEPVVAEPVKEPESASGEASGATTGD